MAIGKVQSFVKITSNGQSQYWCFTYNNYTNHEEFIERCKDITTYGCVGKEVSSTGTQHLQGYIEFTGRYRLGRVKQLLQLGVIHLERRRGTPKEASDYCKKDGDFVEWGELSKGQGHRQDLETIRAKLHAGEQERTIAEEFFPQWLQYGRQLRAYRQLLHPPRERPFLRVLAFTGEPGTGKTRLARQIIPESTWVSCDSSLQWFDGYAGERCVVLDDYRGECKSESFLLRLLDIYPLQVPIKGGFVPFNPDLIVITSNLCPPFSHGDINGPLSRRIHDAVTISEALDFSNTEEVQAILEGIRENITDSNPNEGRTESIMEP